MRLAPVLWKTPWFFPLCYINKVWCFDTHSGFNGRLEESTGLVFRFIIGRTNDRSKMSALKEEVAKYDDFLLLDIEEEYSKLPYKTLVLTYYNWFWAHALYDWVWCLYLSFSVWLSSKLLMPFMNPSFMSRLMMTYIYDQVSSFKKLK